MSLLGTNPQTVGAFDLDEFIRPMYCAVAVTAGTVYQIDLSVHETGTLDWTDVEVVGAELSEQVYCVAQTTEAAGTTSRFVFRGRVEALAGNANVTDGMLCGVEAGGLLLNLAVGSKAIAFALEATADGVIGRFMFDGISGFGFTQET